MSSLRVLYQNSDFNNRNYTRLFLSLIANTAGRNDLRSIETALNQKSGGVNQNLFRTQVLLSFQLISTFAPALLRAFNSQPNFESDIDILFIDNGRKDIDGHSYYFNKITTDISKRYKVVSDNVVYPWHSINLSFCSLLPLVISHLKIIPKLSKLLNLGFSSEEVLGFFKSITSTEILASKFEEYLINQKVKKIVLVVGYGKEWAVWASESAEVQCAELQHGHMSNGHPFYDYSYIQLSQAERKKLGIAPLFFLWDRKWEFVIKSNNLVAQQDLCGIVKPACLFRRDLFPRGEKPILFTSQVGFESEALVILKHLIRCHPHVECRLHPKQIANFEFCENLRNIGIVVNPGGYWIGDDFARCIAHVSLFSTTLYEAIEFSKPNIAVLGMSEYCDLRIEQNISGTGISKLSLGDCASLLASISDKSLVSSSKSIICQQNDLSEWLES